MYQVKIRTPMSTFQYIGGIQTWQEAVILMYQTPGAIGIENLESREDVPFGPNQLIKALSLQYQVDLKWLADLKPCMVCGFDATCRADNPEAPGQLMESGSGCVFEAS